MYTEDIERAPLLNMATGSWSESSTTFQQISNGHAMYAMRVGLATALFVMALASQAL